MYSPFEAYWLVDALYARLLKGFGERKAKNGEFQEKESFRFRIAKREGFISKKYSSGDDYWVARLDLRTPRQKRALRLTPKESIVSCSMDREGLNKAYAWMGYKGRSFERDFARRMMVTGMIGDAAVAMATRVETTDTLEDLADFFFGYRDYLLKGNGKFVVSKPEMVLR